MFQYIARLRESLNLSRKNGEWKVKRLIVSGFIDKVFVADQVGEFKQESLNRYTNRTDVTEDFYRCVVRRCSEEVEFEVDGMRFKATCERIS